MFEKVLKVDFSAEKYAAMYVLAYNSNPMIQGSSKFAKIIKHISLVRTYSAGSFSPMKYGVKMA
jgi:hypothetical protein